MEEIQSAHHGKTDNLGDNDNKLCQCYAGVGNSTGGGGGDSFVNLRVSEGRRRI